MSFYGSLTAEEKFLYPDEEQKKLPSQIRVVMPENGKPGIQLLFQTKGEVLSIELASPDFGVEWYTMKSIPVEYNTGDGVEQGGAMVFEKRPFEKPSYVTRLAPFSVFDCLIPVKGEGNKAVISYKEGDLVPVYFRLNLRETSKTGKKEVLLKVKAVEGEYSCRLQLIVYPVKIPDERFPVTQWFNEEAMCRLHNLDKKDERYYSVLRNYAKAMRQMRQTIFAVNLDEQCVVDKEKGVFDFKYLEPTIKLFFEEGMQRLEIGSFLSRGFTEEGIPDMFTDDFKCRLAPAVSIDSLEGYQWTSRMIQSLAEFLEENGWADRVLIHIHDEPDIHYKGGLSNRQRQYFMVANLIKRYLPHSEIIEAVDSLAFRGGIDVLVCGTAGYEARKEEFDVLVDLGEQVWNYVCCGPEGEWLNRFLDFALIKNRLLFWGFAKNKITGFLHWGFNQFIGEMNPFVATSCPNDTGIGTNFPCGDSFIIYPGEKGPWLSMRLESHRRGIEDLELLVELRKKEPILANTLMDELVTNNHDYRDDPKRFEVVYEKLLAAL